MKDISTLVEDIYGLFEKPRQFSKDSIQQLSDGIATRIGSKIEEQRGSETLRLSNLGSLCTRQLWYKINKPEKAEPLPPYAKLKYLFGDILEELLLFLAREAGHTVENEQETVELHGVTGHIDADIDDTLVDVKSASSYSFHKFKDHLKPEDDAFGYITQINSYRQAKKRKKSAFLVIDKTLGHITLDEQEPREITEEFVNERKEIISQKEPPKRAYMPVPDGKSGNMKLDIACAYCPFKRECWPGLRTFLYSNGPRYLTHVERIPDVPEAKD